MADDPKTVTAEMTPAAAPVSTPTAEKEQPPSSLFQQFRRQAKENDLLEAAKWGKAIYEEDAQKLKASYEAEIKAARSKALDRLPDEEREVLRKEWVEHFKAHGVDDSLFEPGDDGTELDLRAVKLLGQRAVKALAAARAREGKEPAAAPNGDADLLARIRRLETAVSTSPGSPAAHVMQPASGSSRPRVDKDNIDKLWLDGHVKDEEYREFQRNGKLP